MELSLYSIGSYLINLVVVVVVWSQSTNVRLIVQDFYGETIGLINIEA